MEVIKCQCFHAIIAIRAFNRRLHAWEIVFMHDLVPLNRKHPARACLK